MILLDNVTLIYLNGFICLTFAIIQVGLMNKFALCVRTWSLSQVLTGLGLLGLLFLTQEKFNQFWILAPGLLILGQLIKIKALYQTHDLKIERKPLLICLGATVLVIILFSAGRVWGAPLGSLETIVLAPLAVACTFSAWLSGTFGKPQRLLSYLLWLESAVFILLTLGALAAIGGDYIVTGSNIVLYVSTISLLTHLALNIIWQDYIAKLTLSFAENKSSATGHESIVKVAANLSKIKKTAARVKASSSVKSTHSLMNPDDLSAEQKEALLVQLTDKEWEVFTLAAQGMKNKIIADKLNSSEASVKVHRSRMTSKLGVKSVDDLAKFLNVRVTSVQSEIPHAKEVEEVQFESSEADLFRTTM